MMKLIRLQLILLLLSIGLPLTATAQQTQAKTILDQTAAGLKNAGGIKATFQVSQGTGNWQGTILLSGKKFKITTPQTTTWFNGKYLWTYVKENDEVNLNQPTDDELQSINPYNFIYTYANGYSCKMGSITRFQNQSVHEILLTATDRSNPYSQIRLIVSQAGKQPLQIKMLQGKNNWTTITLTAFAKNQKLPESVFSFNKKEAPHAEIIDLR